MVNIKDHKLCLKQDNNQINSLMELHKGHKVIITQLLATVEVEKLDAPINL